MEEANSKELATAEMLAQYAYCPRRMYLMFLDGRWDSNFYTEHGLAVHRRTDAQQDTLPTPATNPPEGEPEPTTARSVLLADETLGLIAKPDIIEAEGMVATPVEIKRGTIPNTPTHTYEPECVQLMAQALLLRAHGFTCNQAMVYYAESRRRVIVPLDTPLEVRTRDILRLVKETILNRTEQLPPPLQDSPKCNGCSLAGICLPDETNFSNNEASIAPENHSAKAPDNYCDSFSSSQPTAQMETEQDDETIPDVRRLFPARSDALPLYVQTQGARIGKSGETLNIEKGDQKLGVFPLKDVSQVVICGNVFISPQCTNMLCSAGIPIVHLSMGHWFYGITYGSGEANAYDRAAQFRIAADKGKSLEYARQFVVAKARNQRTMLRRNAMALPDQVLYEMQRLILKAENVSSAEELLGIEGNIARLYFQHFGKMLKSEELKPDFQPEKRNRRPPQDPLNALLSFGYALLVKEVTVAIMAEGLDPWWGLYHRPRHGKPALALDLMEEFRPLVVDSAVITLLNNDQVDANGFVCSCAGCAMSDATRKKLIAAFEQRLDQLVTHPVFNYRCSWRAIIRLQCKLLAKSLRGDIKDYMGMTTR